MVGGDLTSLILNHDTVSA